MKDSTNRKNKMKTSVRYKAIGFLLKKMRFLHIDPYQPERVKIRYGLLTLVFMVHFMQYFYAFALIANPKTDFVGKASGFKTIAANSHLIKIFSLFYTKDVIYLLSNLDRFLESESAEKWYKYGSRGAVGYQNCMWLAFLIIFISPTVLGYIPFEGDYPVFPYSTYLFGLIQCIQFSYGLIVNLVTDGLFTTMSFLVYAQFMLLNERLAKLGEHCDDEKMYREAMICVKHQKFLYEYVDRYCKIFTGPLLVQYFITTASICVEMFVFAKRDLIGKFFGITHIVSLLCQFSMYCFPADIIIQEALESGEAILSSKWYEHPSVSKTFAQHIIRRSQKPILFKAGGFFEINKGSLTLIFKWCFSLYAMMSDIDRLIE